LRLGELDEVKLRGAISAVLTDPGYRSNAHRLRAAIERSGGVRKAAEIIETVARTQQPVVSLCHSSPR
jgi:UDP:flavonoid glycosyltransferase YjiC (YdhE family)